MQNIVDHMTPAGAAPITTQEHFTPVERDASLRWQDPQQKFVAYCLAHQRVSPQTADGPHILILGCFETREQARDFATEVSHATEVTTLVSPTHEWFVAPSSYERIEDAASLRSHVARIIADAEAASVSQAQEAEDRKKVMQSTSENFGEWVTQMNLQLDDVTMERLQQWVTDNDYTMLRVACMSPEEAESFGVNYEELQARTQQYRDVMISSDTSNDPVETDTQKTSEHSTDGEGGLKRRCRIPRDLELRDQHVAIVSTLPDTVGTLNEPLIKVYGCVETVDDADAFIRNTAGSIVRDVNIGVLQMYEWAKLCEHETAPPVHRDKNLDNIIRNRNRAPEQVAKLQAELAADAKKHAHAALQGTPCDTASNQEPLEEPLEEID